MLLNIGEIQKGDEILIPLSAGFRYVKVTRVAKPCVIKQPDGSKILRKSYDGRQVYTSIKGTTKMERHEKVITYGSNAYTRKWKTYECTPDDHNVEEYYNLWFKQVWLVRRDS